MKSNAPQPKPVLLVGIDWADKKHAVWWLTDDNQAERHESFNQQPEAIAQWVESLHQRFPGHRIKIALEQSRGPLFIGLAGFKQLELYPINPKQLASYREAIFPTGGKSDPSDARLLARFLQHQQKELRPWQPDDTTTRQIGELATLRRNMVEDRKSLGLKLLSCLKLYFPQAIELTTRDLHHDLTLDLLRRWPSLQLLKRAHPKTLRAFLKEHGLKSKDDQTAIIEKIRSAKPLTNDKALIGPQASYAQMLVQQIRDLNQAIGQFEKQLDELVKTHDDHDMYRSLPGAGDALIPRLIAALGSDRDRFDSAESVQCFSGIAPITKQTGKTKHVNKRIACPKFIRQTFHEFADHSRRWSTWAGAYYRMKADQNMKHHAILRSLAYKWIRIIFRLWKNREKYSEEVYLEQLKKNNSPVLGYIQS